MAWARDRYGDPCRDCRYGWDLSLEQCIGVIADVPARCVELLTGVTAATQHPDLSWSVGGYACHINDNLRIWTERLAGAALGGTTTVRWYDADALASARDYGGVPIEGSLWAMAKAARDWTDAVRLAAGAGVTFRHPERGWLEVIDVARGNAHDAHHHVWDIQRSVVGG
jgi:DinB family protein